MLVLGVIIDTFAGLRSESEKKEWDKNNVCFICGLNKKDIDKSENKNDFYEHTKLKHNMLKYLFYIAYINEKQDTELTGIESYVKECLQSRSIKWFPMRGK